MQQESPREEEWEWVFQGQPPTSPVVSVPLDYEFLPVDILSKEFTKLNNPHDFRIHFLGPRYTSSLAMHRKLAQSLFSPTKAVPPFEATPRYQVDMQLLQQSRPLQERLRSNSYYKSTLFYRAFEGMNPSLELGQEYVFNSAFECGNLDCAIKVDADEFDLFLRVDTNTRGHALWFFFSVRNFRPHQRLRLNLCNLSKARTLYSQGMRPYVFSRAKSGEWAQGASNCGLARQQLRYDILRKKGVENSFNSLTLEYQFGEGLDEVYFAYCAPYSYSRLLGELTALPGSIARWTSLGKSLSGLDIPLVQICEGRPSDKYTVLITGRAHPAESNSSWVVGELMTWLCSGDPEAVRVRKCVCFLVVPMVNPDGVVVGNTRTSLAGKDLNRQFVDGRRELYPEVHLLRELASHLVKNCRFLLYLDCHGHSRKKNSFMYGPAFSICESSYCRVRVFPKLLEKESPLFRYFSCSFAPDEDKKKTARYALGVLGVEYSYTLEASIGHYYDAEAKQTFPFSPGKWAALGAATATALSKFLNAYEMFQRELSSRKLARLKRKQPAIDVPESVNSESTRAVSDEKSPLKIQYNTSELLFASLLEEIKKDASKERPLEDSDLSDDHDSQEDLAPSKMRELDNLIIDFVGESKAHSAPIWKSISKPATPNRAPDEEEPVMASFVKAQARKTVSQGRRRLPSNQRQRIAHKESQVISRNMIRREHSEKSAASTMPFALKRELSERKPDRSLACKTFYFSEFKWDIDPKIIERSGKRRMRNSLFLRDHTHASHLRPEPRIKEALSGFRSFEFKFDDLAPEHSTAKVMIRKGNRMPSNNLAWPLSFHGLHQNLNSRQRRHELDLSRAAFPNRPTAGKRDSIRTEDASSGQESPSKEFERSIELAKKESPEQPP